MNYSIIRSRYRPAAANTPRNHPSLYMGVRTLAYRGRVCVVIATFILASILFSAMPGFAQEPFPLSAPSKKASLAARRHFRRQVVKVEGGINQAQVEALLGKPDDIRQAEPGTPPVEVWWCYGVDEPGSLVTLGKIGFDESGVMCSNRPEYPGYAAPPEGVLTEPELRHLMQLVSTFQQDHYGLISTMYFKPLSLIRAVNSLLPYGKRKILAAIEEYQRLYQDERAIPVLLLALFEVPRELGYLPRLTYEEAQPSNIFDRKRVPRYPLVIIDDVPIMIANIPMINDIYIVKRIPMTDYFRVHCKLRSRPLVPSDEPFEVLEKFLDSPQNIWRRTDPKGQKSDSVTHPHVIIPDVQLWIAKFIGLLPCIMQVTTPARKGN